MIKLNGAINKSAFKAVDTMGVGTFGCSFATVTLGEHHA